MTKMMSVCGVICSDCSAYRADEKGIDHQQRTAAAWKKIYGLDERPEDIACGGCLAADDQLFHTSRTCKARLCCRARGFSTCAECAEKHCPDLETAQSLWDGVPNLARTLSSEDFTTYAQPYCDHRLRLAKVRMERAHRSH